MFRLFFENSKYQVKKETKDRFILVKEFNTQYEAELFIKKEQDKINEQRKLSKNALVENGCLKDVQGNIGNDWNQ